MSAHVQGPTPSAPATVLVVDDNESNRAVVQGALEDEGYRVLMATDGEEGVRLVESQRPDCVLLDVKMPKLDGPGACQRIRGLPHGADTPIIFLTALRDVDTFDRALAAGGNDFLTKPVRPAELVVRVESALKIRRMGAELQGHYELLRRQRDDLMRVQLQKERLMAFVVHDLKNPVNSIDLFAQVLLRDAGLPENARASVAQIRVEARLLNRMVMNLLDLSKADEGKLTAKREPVDLSTLVADVITELEMNATRRNVTLRAALDAPRVYADPDLLRRSLANLVENALRHAPTKSDVTVASAARGDHVELRVSDRGAGVPEAMRGEVFQAFVQMEGEGRPKVSGGRGLGLAFCRLAVEAHGGRIWVEDGKPGAVFCMSIPNDH